MAAKPTPKPQGSQSGHAVTNSSNYTKSVTPEPRPTAISDLQPILRIKNEETGQLEIKQGKFGKKIYDVSGDRMVFNKKETDTYFPSKPAK